MARPKHLQNDGFWFGTLQSMRWIKTPRGGAEMSLEGWGVDDTFLAGGALVRQSWGGHRAYTFEWGDSNTREMAMLLQAYRNGTYGRGLIYFLNPLSYDKNILPARWADPSITVDDEGQPLVYGVYPTGVVTSGWETNGLPVSSAYYLLDEIQPGYRTDQETLFVPIPEGYTLFLGAVFQATGSGGVFVTEVDIHGHLGSTTPLTAVDARAPGVTNATFSGGMGVRLWVGKSGNDSASVTLTAMTARLGETSRVTINGVPEQVRTNLATNPKGVGASGSTPPSGWTMRWWGGGAGDGHYNVVSGGNGFERTWDLAGASNGDVWGGPDFDASGGDTLSFSMSCEIVYFPGSPPPGLEARIDWLDSGDNIIGTSVGDMSPVFVGTPVTISVTDTAPVGTARGRAYAYPSGGAPEYFTPEPGTKLRFQDPLVETSPTAGQPFSGDTPSTKTVIYKWTGEANASPSTETTVTPGYAALSTGPWISGMGNSGCRFVGFPTEVANTGLGGGRISVAATFKEVGDFD